MKTNNTITILGVPIVTTVLSACLLASATIHADDVVDEINLTVPVSCSLSGAGMNTHNAEINNGQYNSAIGETTVKAFCNDSEGFAIYTIGYTDNIAGKNVLSNSTLGSTHDIATGTAISGDTSNWAMKLTATTNPTPTYPITIQNSFDSFHAVPDSYTLVAKRTSGTDVGTSAEGSSFKSTYQAYISKTQPAGTYTGQVKYTLVHPNTVDKTALDNAVTVVFDGNGLTFPDGSTTNTVRYANVRDKGEVAYVSNTVGGISKSPNVNNDGTKNVPIAKDDSYSDTVTIAGADKLKIVLNYDFDSPGATSSNANCYVNIADDYNLYSDYYGTGTDTITAEGDTAYFYFTCWGDIDENHDYGYYAEVYPAYDTEQPNTTSEVLPSNNYTFMPISGAYAETTEWHNKWIATIDGYDYEFKADRYCDNDWCSIDNTARGSLQYYLSGGYDYLKGTTLVVYAYNPVTFDEAYAEANKTKVNGYYVIQDLTPSICANVTLGEITTVIDVRDNNTYSIARIENDKCWLRDNLRLNPTDSTVAANLSSANTDASDDAIYNFLNGGNPNSNTGWSSVSVSYSDSESITEPKLTTYYDSIYNESFAIYNYCAVTVGTYCHPLKSSTQDSQYSLCPVNWKLPSSSFSSSYPDVDLLKLIYHGNLGWWTSKYADYSQTQDFMYLGQSNSSYPYNYFRIVREERMKQNSVRCILSPSS